MQVAVTGGRWRTKTDNDMGSRKRAKTHRKPRIIQSNFIDNFIEIIFTFLEMF